MDKLSEKIAQIKESDHNADVTPLIMSVIVATQNKEGLLYLLSMLASEYSFLGRLDDAERTLHKIIDLDPDRPDGWIRLSEFHFYMKEEMDAAFSTIQIAVQKAEAEGNFVRQAKGVLIRIALEMQKYTIVDDTLRQLIKYAPKSESLDVALEDDFLDRIPRQLVDTSIIEQYREKCEGERSSHRDHPR
jgi:tetratricopeptide (TPR) repeat protein